MISFSVIIILFLLMLPDLRRKQIPIRMLIIMGCVVIVLRVIFTILNITETSFVGIMTALMPGCVFLILSFVTREQIGYGDGVVLLIMGALYSFWRLMMILGVALSLTSFLSIFLLLVRKGNRHTKLPFIPFLWFGAIIEWILEMS